MRLPLMSRNSHDDIIAAKDMMIATLGVELDHAREALESQAIRHQTAMLALINTLKPSAPVAAAETPVPRTEPRPKPVEEIDWARIDPTDNKALARIAAQELGSPANRNAGMLLRKINHIRNQVIEAQKRVVRSGEMVDDGPPTEPVPEYIQRTIDEAAGKTEA